MSTLSKADIENIVAELPPQIKNKFAQQRRSLAIKTRMKISESRLVAKKSSVSEN
jgi:hypothetical protein